MQSTIDYKKELNPSQYEAVSFLGGPALVIAGAGSGKTRTLVYRVAYLLEQGILPENILLLTFTRKAASEMLFRAGQLAGSDCQRISGGTFHSFANLILRKYAPKIGYNNNFTILDEADAENLMKQVKDQLFFEDKKLPNKGGLKEMLSYCINKDADLEDFINDVMPQFKDKVDKIKNIFDGYKILKGKNGAMDYDDLLINLKKLLKENPEIRKRISNQYRYIMIDEYQDTNKIQSEIAELLCSEHKNIMVVGDDSQSIYSFRGADFKNIMDFPKHFAGAKVIMLETNYRSTQPILDLTNKIIAKAKEKYSKNLQAIKGAGPKPIYAEFASEKDQAKYIVDKIKGFDCDLSQTAVLFRSSWHSNELELELVKNRIPFVKYGGIKFVETAHTKDLLSFLRADFNFADTTAWERILSLHKGVGEKTAQKIIFQINQNQTFDVLNDYKLQSLFVLFKDLKDKINPLEKLQKISDYYKPILKTKYIDDFNKREKDVDSLLEIAGRYEEIERFLSDTVIESPEDPDFSVKKGKLVLSTIHSAKGLEWKNVFLINLVDGLLPSLRSLDNLEEERRLLYVALTRAQDNLFLTKPLIRPRMWSQDAMEHDFSAVCRFVDTEIMAGDYLEKILQVAQQPKKKGYLDMDLARFKANGPKKKSYLDFNADYIGHEKKPYPYFKKKQVDDDIQYINDW